MEQLVVRMREIRNSYYIFWGKQREEMVLDDNIVRYMSSVANNCGFWIR
jgi:hypothetical protein